MYEFTVQTELQKFDSILSLMKQTDANNEYYFRMICKQVFEKAFLEFGYQEVQDSKWFIGEELLFTAIEKFQGNYEEGSFEKSLSNLLPIDHSSELNKIISFIARCELSKLVKLVQIQYTFGLEKAISFVDSE